MKFIFVTFLGLLAVCQANPVKINQDLLVSEELVRNFLTDYQNAKAGGISAILNEYADKVFTNIQQFIIHSGLDPLSIPEIHEGFNFTLIITYHGELDMTNGWINDISTIHRDGDVEVVYTSDKQLFVTIPIAFDVLSLTYDYSAKLMNLGPTGGVEGKITNVRVKVAIAFDWETFVARLDTFDLVNTGHIDLNFSGNVLTDWIIDLFLDVATAALKPIILWVMETIIKNPIEGVVEAINQIIQNILNPTTTTTAAPLLIS